MSTAQLAQRSKSSPNIVAKRANYYRATHYRSALTIGKCADLERRDALTQAIVQLLQNTDLIDQQQQALDDLLALLAEATSLVARLTRRQHQVMELVVAGHCNKNIAADLGISQRSVEHHRAAIMRKTGSASIPALVRLAFIATWKCAGEPHIQRALGN